MNLYHSTVKRWFFWYPVDYRILINKWCLGRKIKYLTFKGGKDMCGLQLSTRRKIFLFRFFNPIFHLNSPSENGFEVNHTFAKYVYWNLENNFLTFFKLCSALCLSIARRLFFSNPQRLDHCPFFSLSQWTNLA